MAETVIATNQITWPEFSNGQTPTVSAWAHVDNRDDEYEQKRYEDATGSYLTPDYAAAGDKFTFLGACAGPLVAGDYVAYVDIDLGTTTSAATLKHRPLGGATGLLGTFPASGSRGRELVILQFTLEADLSEYESRIGIVSNPAAPTGMKLYGMRLDLQAAEDDLGVFSGATAATEDTSFRWVDVPYASASEALGAEVGPDPAPGASIILSVMTMLGYDPNNEEDSALALEVVESITLMVRAYTRGGGFTLDPVTGEESAARDLTGVIKLASARLMANPSGLTYRAGTESVTDAFKGWTLAETYVLNNYRRRQS